MHHYRSYRHIFTLRLSAVTFLLMILALAAGVLVASVAMVDSNRNLMKWVLICWAIGLVSFLVYRISAAMNRCPLCQNPPMVSKSCRKHRHALMIFGSYRITVASSVLLRNHFRCPYCGESSRCTLRNVRHESHDEERMPRLGQRPRSLHNNIARENFSDLL